MFQDLWEKLLAIGFFNSTESHVCPRDLLFSEPHLWRNGFTAMSSAQKWRLLHTKEMSFVDKMQLLLCSFEKGKTFITIWNSGEGDKKRRVEGLQGWRITRARPVLWVSVFFFSLSACATISNAFCSFNRLLFGEERAGLKPLSVRSHSCWAAYCNLEESLTFDPENSRGRAEATCLGLHRAALHFGIYIYGS